MTPLDVFYIDRIMHDDEATRYFNILMKDTPWKNDEVVIFGKYITTKRQVAWFGDCNFQYTYSNKTKTALPWTTTLLELKEKVEAITKTSFNSCLLNLYHDGSEGLGWHSDDEKELGNNTIASLSLGATRRFLFKNKTTKETVEYTLHHGSLVIMAGNTQKDWLHSIPPSKKVRDPRINLTFRTFSF